MAINYTKILNLARDNHWHAAHEMVQPFSDSLSCQIHAYLHRVEGDDWNADYWYRKAGMQRPENTLEEELARLNTLAGREKQD
ncbi:MAG TPA: hypothetical protein EYP34_12095 [Chromatiaceae bacterium]|nr:hypothetical protein [Chromatiaceae bacterium]